MKANIFLLAPAAIFGSAVAGHGVVYLNVEQAQRAIFPGASFTAAHRTLTGEQRKAIEAAGGVPARRPQIKAWRTSGGGWFIVDEVLGKHEFITYAVGIAADDACFLAFDHHGALASKQGFMHPAGGAFHIADFSP